MININFRPAKIEKYKQGVQIKNMVRRCFVFWGCVCMALAFGCWILSMIIAEATSEHVCMIIDYETGTKGIRSIIQESDNAKGWLKWKCGNLDKSCFEQYIEEYPIGLRVKCWKSGTIVYHRNPYKEMFDLYLIF